MTVRIHELRPSLVTLLFLILVGSGILFGAKTTDFLKYSLKAKPGDSTVDRMPTTDPNAKSYQEEFDFVVRNPTRTDFKGTAPTSQKFDVEVFFVGIDHETSVWKWSSGQKFSNIVTPVPIPAGQSWTPEQKVIWNFKAADVKDGKYRAVATFIPTGSKKGGTSFVIKSVE